VPRDPEEKAMQRALMHYFKPYNRELVLKALRKAGREDLIGFGRDCLVPPRAVPEGGRRGPAVREERGRAPSPRTGGGPGRGAPQPRRDRDKKPRHGR